MAAFWAVFTFGGSGPALTVHGSLDLKQEIQSGTNTFIQEEWEGGRAVEKIRKSKRK
jgi:hypothetical protein